MLVLPLSGMDSCTKKKPVETTVHFAELE